MSGMEGSRIHKYSSLAIATTIIVAAIVLGLYVFSSVRVQHYQAGELNLTITSDKTHVKKGEVFEIQLNLTNVGSQKIRVYKLIEQISYYIRFNSYNLTSYRSQNINRSAPDDSCFCIGTYYGQFYKCQAAVTRILLTDNILVDLSPGQSITIVEDSHCWDLPKGEYNLTASYSTLITDNRFTVSYWQGRVNSNEITIYVE